MADGNLNHPPIRPADHFLLVTIDTEGDDAWARRRRVETRNAAFLPRFQALCERHGVRPTYLTNYEMAMSPVFRALGHEVLRRDTAEIGMHLHAWHSPPDYPLTADDTHYHPYLVEYPVEIMRAKIAFMTDLLEETFGRKMASHRAGRWSLNETYARLLVEHGYRADCSVTPHVSWRFVAGDPRRRGGTDYSRFPDTAYFVDLDDIARPGDSQLLEVPVTIVPARASLRRVVSFALPQRATLQRAMNRLFPLRWLRPNGRNLPDLLRVVDRAVVERRRYIELMLHSSELMPGGSPTFRTVASIETLYDHLERLFAHAARFFRGATLSQFDDLLRRRQQYAVGRLSA
jgi:hypothetical protein